VNICGVKHLIVLAIIHIETLQFFKESFDATERVIKNQGSQRPSRKIQEALFETRGD